MATLTIRGLDDGTIARLGVSAARHGRSIEAEVQRILEGALPSQQASDGLGSRIRGRFSAVGGAELDLPSRDEMPRGE